MTDLRIRRLPILALMAGLGLAASCAILPPFQFNAEARAIEAEAATRFPPGSQATEFEAWFVAKMGPGLGAGIGPQKEPGGRPSCERKTMVLSRAEGCMNQLIAQYCVEGDGKLAELTFTKSGYC